MTSLQLEYEFTLPRGYVDERGQVHRQGVMRLATARDEITPLRDPRVRANEAYLIIILLSQVITQLGTVPRITPGIIENLFAADLIFLQDFYQQINEPEIRQINVNCPNCGHDFEVEMPLLGES